MTAWAGMARCMLPAWARMTGCVALAALLQGCGLFGGGTAACENPQMYQNAEVAEPLVAAEGLETPQVFGNLEIPEGEVLAGLPRRSNGSCLEEPPQIEPPGAR